MAPHPHHAAPPGIGHEHTDVRIRPVVAAGVGLGVAVIFVALLMLGFYGVLASYVARQSPPQNPLAAAEGPRLPPEPRLQVRPVRDLRELRAAESQLLDHYGWVDRNAGVVRVPIARAIDMLAARSAAGAQPGGGR